MIPPRMHEWPAGQKISNRRVVWYKVDPGRDANDWDVAGR